MTTSLELVFDGPSEIAVAVASNPAIVLLDTGKRDDLYAHIQREVDDFVPDLTTVKGREAIKALAFKITRTKTAIDAAGKTLNEEARAKINVVDAARRDSKAKLEAMADAVRQPLTEWEEAEKARVAACEAEIAAFIAAGNVSLDDTADSVRKRGEEVWNQTVDEARYGTLFDRAVAAKDATVERLAAALARLTREEADRAELAKLRAEQEERAERDRLAAEQAERVRAEAERVENERIGAERAEAARVAAEEAQAERVRLAAENAANEAERAAERKAQEERDRVQAEHAAQLAAERERADAADRARKAEADRIERERVAQETARQKEADEQAKREANRAHISRVMRTAKEAIMTCGADEAVAKAIVVAIKANTIPAVAIRF